MDEQEKLSTWPVFFECLFCGFQSLNPDDLQNHLQPIPPQFIRGQKVSFSVRDQGVVVGFVTSTKHRTTENGHKLIYQISTVPDVYDLVLEGVRVLDKHIIEVEASAEILFGFPLPTDF